MSNMINIDKTTISVKTPTEFYYYENLKTRFGPKNFCAQPVWDIPPAPSYYISRDRRAVLTAIMSFASQLAANGLYYCRIHRRVAKPIVNRILCVRNFSPILY